MTDVRPVARLLRPLTTTLLVLFLLMAGIGIAGLLAVDRAFAELTRSIEPAADASRALMADMVNMETGVRAYAQSGLSSGLRPYRAAQDTYTENRRTLGDFAESDAELLAAVRIQDDAVRAWLADYAVPRISSPGGPGTYNPERFARGTRRFDELRAANAAVDDVFAVRVEDAASRADWWLRGTLGVLALLAVSAVAAITRVRTRVIAELQEPLVELERVVQALAANDFGVRADLDRGPIELRAVARSFNELAEVNERGRAVEQHITDEMRVLDTAKSDFVSNVTHELRTPLTTISGYLELLGEEFEDGMPDRHQKMYDATRRNVDRLMGLVNDLLTLSRAENRATDLEQVDVLHLVQDCVTDLRMTAARRDIGVTLSTSATGRGEGHHLVLGDEAMLTRVFLNVLSNAVKFSRDDGSVEVLVERSGDEVAVVVRDQGIGIPADDLDKLGGRFFRASNAVTQHVSGTGLGLRIVQTIIAKHGGTMAIESVVDEGTTVTVRLPLQA